MKRLILLLVPATAFVLGAGVLGPVQLPPYVPSDLCRARVVSEFDHRRPRHEIREADRIQPGILLIKFITTRTSSTFLVKAKVAPEIVPIRHDQLPWIPPNVPDPETLLRAIVLRASESFGIAPENMVVIVSCGFAAHHQFCFAVWSRGKIQILPPDASGAERESLWREARPKDMGH